MLESLIDPPTKTRLLYPRSSRSSGLDPAALQVLIAVKLLGSVPVGTVARRLALRSPSVSTALATLRERGLVTTAASSDGRAHTHQITRSGQRLVKAFARDACAGD